MKKMNKLILAFTFCFFTIPVIAQTDSANAPQEQLVASASLPVQPDNDALSDFSGPKLRYHKIIDPAITIPCAAFAAYSFPIIYSKDDIDSAVLAGLKKEDIPAFDRWAVKHSDNADAASNILFYAAMPLPLVLMLDKDIRHDGGRVAGLYVEAMGITGLLYTGSNMAFNRYRPETYDETKPFKDRLSGNEKNAFFAGHVALVATSFFFTASVYDIYHPQSKLKWAFYGAAVAATATTIYLRHMAGKHFPSDLLVGTIVGVGSGMLVPRLHRPKAGKKQALMVMPSVGQGLGFAATYTF
jgi:membrane-associated phospholipid phosphatase